MKIKKIKAREILDSRGEPTIEAELETKAGVFKAEVPSGTSEGKHEAVELRDGGKRYGGRGVRRAVENINEKIFPKIKGEDVREQKKIDQILIDLDGTKNKSKLGANALLAVSMAVCRAGARSKNIALYQHIGEIFNPKFSLSGIKFPKPCFNIINGGAHAGGNLAFQEFMIIPQNKSFEKNLETGVEIYHKLKEVLKKNFGNLAINVGYEGGFAPPVSKTGETLELIKKFAKKYYNTRIGVDCAASYFYKNKKYKLEGKSLTAKGLLNFYKKLIKDYPIIFLEDAFQEEDWPGFQLLTKELGGKIIIFGDDLLATNIERIKKAKQKKACTGLVLKPDQVGTVSETLEAVRLAKFFDWKIIVAHRSGDTCDDFIADLAVGIEADFIKAGAPCRGERTAKYNRLLKIEKEISE